ncbi:MAG TPA: hypothetical protein PK867_15995, partial [Pirellulales bacterium]|nr:hypothetical protein [Pirellulales bacterium]
MQKDVNHDRVRMALVWMRRNRAAGMVARPAGASEARRAWMVFRPAGSTESVCSRMVFRPAGARMMHTGAWMRAGAAIVPVAMLALFVAVTLVPLALTVGGP